MGKVYLTIGNIGSGKSTWSRKTADNSPDKLLIINRDSLRRMVAGSYRYSLDTEPVLKQMAKSILEISLSRGYDVVLDETNITAKNRKRWLRVVHNLDQTHEAVYVIFDDHGNNVKWRMKDDGRGYDEAYWNKVYLSMKHQFEMPSMAEFDDIGIKGNIIRGDKYEI